jgi:pyruvate dehydrogenase E2 component (dihydrolipoamide acetyltransferase)
MTETVTMPKLGFDMAEGKLIRWVKAEGEIVNKGDVLAEIETDKATVEVQSGFSGVVYRHMVEQGSLVPVGAPIAIIAGAGEKVVESRPAVEESQEKGIPKPAILTTPNAAAMNAPTVSSGALRASPLAKRVAADHSLDLHQVSGSGPGGRIVRKDVETFLAQPGLTGDNAGQRPSPSTLPLPDQISLPVAPSESDLHIPLEKIRAAIGRRLVEAKQQIPHFYVTHAYDMAPMLKLRSEVNQLLPEDQKLSVNDFIVKGVAMALRQYPNLNASLAGNEIIRHAHINIGVAVAVSNGLLTVVCRDTDTKPIRMISEEVRGLASRARSGKVRTDDIEGSTFSISNLGMYEVEEFTAIINPPEVAILAVGSARQVPMVVNGEVHPGSQMKATLSADHRVTDGAEAAQFLQALAIFLEQPLRLML